MKFHTTDEGWQIFDGLESAGYTLCGHGLPEGSTSVPDLLARYSPQTLVLQDKREWDVQRKDFRDASARFTGVEALRERDDVFKLTILKDSHQRPEYHRDSAQEIGCHAWIVYYHPTIVSHLAPYVRTQHLVRTYHTLNPAHVPAYSIDRLDRCLLSGAVSGAYPLRQRMVNNLRAFKTIDYQKHPGYHRQGCCTPEYLKMLSRYKVSFCTASHYGYLLRKIIESVACGCRVITDMPVDEVVPEIDDNLIRINPMDSIHAIEDQIAYAIVDYDPERQEHFAKRAIERFDYRFETARLAGEIENLRLIYTGDN